VSTTDAQIKFTGRPWFPWQYRGGKPELTLRSQAKDLHLVRPFSVDGGNQTVDKYDRVRAPGRRPKFPQRPQADVLSDAITLFFIARNSVGFWIAREAKRRTGGIFLFKNSALRFAKENSGASGCATMFLAERLELDVMNRGNQLIGWIAIVMSLLAQYVPDYPLRSR
jgi:hypothetical protein